MNKNDNYKLISDNFFLDFLPLAHLHPPRSVELPLLVHLLEDLKEQNTLN